jgi:uncharacterized surface protein with fasciclin (FAS1) repeats
VSQDGVTGRPSSGTLRPAPCAKAVMISRTLAPETPDEDVRQVAAHEHDILTTAEGSPRLGVFVDFMRAAGLGRFLLGEGPFTVFAPTERAFLKLSIRQRDALLADPERLSRVMRGHVIAGRVLSPMSDGPSAITTIDGETLQLTSRDGTHRVERSRIVQTNIPASNGIIHAIDSILL